MTAPTPAPVLLTDAAFDEQGILRQIVRQEPSEENIGVLVRLTSLVSHAWHEEAVLAFRDAQWRAPFEQRLVVFRDSIDDASTNSEVDVLVRGMNMYRGLFSVLSDSSGEACEESLSGLHDMVYQFGSAALNARMLTAGVLESIEWIMRTYPIAEARGVCVQRNCVALLYQMMKRPAGLVVRMGSAAMFGRVASTMIANPGDRELLTHGVDLLLQGFEYRTPECVHAVIAFMHAHRSGPCFFNFTRSSPTDWGWREALCVWRDALCLLSSLLETPGHLVLTGGTDFVFCPSVTDTHSVVVGQQVVEMIVGGLHLLETVPDSDRCLQLDLSVALRTCTVIAQIAAVLDDAVTESIVDAGGVRALLVLLTKPRMSAYPDVRWLYQDACVALEFLCSSSATVQQHIADEGGVAALENVLAWHVFEGTNRHTPTPLCVERANLVLRALGALDAPQ